MGTKQKPGEYDCYNSALPDEPMFVLLARDPRGPQIVNVWANARAYDVERGERPESDLALVEEARQCADMMKTWRAANDGKWRQPPIPANVYYSADASNFYSVITGIGMGNEFYLLWRNRSKEFPQSLADCLKPCPFCGSHNIDPEGWASTERKGPACDDCGATADTVEMWNTRAS